MAVVDEYQGFLRNAEAKGTIVYNGVDINSDYLKEKLEEDKLIILAGEIENSLHAILLCGYVNDDFIVCDPLYNKKRKLSILEIEKFMNTNIGKWCVTVSQNTKNKDMLMSK